MHDAYLTFLANCRVHDVMGLSRPEWELAGSPTFEQYEWDARVLREKQAAVIAEELPEFRP